MSAAALEHDVFRMNLHRALAYFFSMIFFGKPVPTLPDHALSPFGDEAIAQGTDPSDVDLDDVAGLEVRRGAVGAHPDHVARPQCEILRQFDDERDDSEDHLVGVEAAGLLAVDLDDGLHLVEIDI